MRWMPEYHMIIKHLNVCENIAANVAKIRNVCHEYIHIYHVYVSVYTCNMSFVWRNRENVTLTMSPYNGKKRDTNYQHIA